MTFFLCAHSAPVYILKTIMSVVVVVFLYQFTVTRKQVPTPKQASKYSKNRKFSPHESLTLLQMLNDCYNFEAENSAGCIIHCCNLIISRHEMYSMWTTLKINKSSCMHTAKVSGIHSSCDTSCTVVGCLI